jgi:hypothetical protein
MVMEPQPRLLLPPPLMMQPQPLLLPPGMDPAVIGLKAED